MTPRVDTIVFLVRDDEILLAMKKRGQGVGLWNGAGGKVEPGETIEEAMIRECQEEIMVTPTEYKQVAIHNFEWAVKAKEPSRLIDAHTFVATAWEGEPQETEEMAPKWFKIDEIPFAQMWQDDILWLPLVLKGKKLQTHFVFDENNTMISAELTRIRKWSKLKV